jgi:hypothetical protein
MSLYLCVFAGSQEIAGVEVGTYAEFNALRARIAPLEGGPAGTRFPVLMLHSDCEGEWSVAACAQLERELATIVQELADRPPQPFPSEAQARLAAERGLVPRHAGECFLDVDGSPLLGRLQALVAVARHAGFPLLFQ